MLTFYEVPLNLEMPFFLEKMLQTEQFERVLKDLRKYLVNSVLWCQILTDHSSTVHPEEKLGTP